jgi:dolichol-phosphate mannosyltransferase
MNSEITAPIERLVSIVFPVYQNRESLSELYKRLTMALDNKFSRLRFEFIFVNDGSTDGSLDILRQLKFSSGDSRIRIIALSRNFGQAAATLAGLRNARGDAAIYLAADLQDPPEQCVPMIEEWLKGNEIVVSHRISHGTSLSRSISSRIFYKLLLPNAPQGGFDFALMGRKALNGFVGLKERNRFGQYDVLWLGFSIKYLPYHKAERPFGRSQSGFIRRFSTFSIHFLNTSYLPLRFMTTLGTGFAFTGFGYALIIVYAYFAHQTPFKGWAPLMVLILVIGGLTMTMLGILGEYIWRIFDEVKARPMYLIDNEY